MLRTAMIALAAVATMGMASVSTSTDASAAWHGHGGWHGGWHGGGWHRGFGPRFGFYGAPYGYAAYGGCYQLRRVWTPYGPRLRRINVCG